MILSTMFDCCCSMQGLIAIFKTRKAVSTETTATSSATRCRWLRRAHGLQVALSQSLDDLPEGCRSSEDLPVSPLLKIRSWFRISRQYAAEHRQGSGCAEVVRSLAVQRSKRHKDTGVRPARQAEVAMEDAAMEGMQRCKSDSSPVLAPRAPA